VPRWSAPCCGLRGYDARSRRFYADGHSAVLADERGGDRTGLRALEDQAIRDAVRRQVEIGLDVVTEGELRRWMFLNSFYDAVEGFRTDNVVNFRNARGEEAPLRVDEIVECLRPVSVGATFIRSRRCVQRLIQSDRRSADIRIRTGGEPGMWWNIAGVGCVMERTTARLRR
jgi:hypothetical protein